MSKLSEIAPTNLLRMIDLVRAAGVDVSDWSNCQGGEKNASRNPKYCYEWSYIEPKKVVVLNLWYDFMEENDDCVIMRRINMREFAATRPFPENDRSLKFDAAIQTAINERLPIRVIILGRKTRDANKPKESSSRVSARLLDPLNWSVAKYDRQSGDSILQRDREGDRDRFVDQFSIDEKSMQPPNRRTVSGQVFDRSTEVREKVLSRANGKCEWCGMQGFVMKNGKIYLETHHIIPLREDGLDCVSNVAALCANHHREAHHGKNKTEIRKTLLRRFAEYPARSQSHRAR